MAFTHRDTQGSTAEGATSLTITKPTGLTAGDLMVAMIGKDDDPAPTSAPTGFTLEASDSGTGGNDNWGGVYWKEADASDVAASNFTWQGDAEDWAGVLSAFTPANGITLDEGSSIRREADTTPATNSIADVATGSLVVGGCVGSQAAGPSGYPSVVSGGYTEPTNGNQTTGSGNGDVGTTLCYDLDSGSGSISIEFGNIVTGEESVSSIIVFVDEAAAATNTVMPHLWKFATGV